MTATFIGDIHGWSRRLERILAQTEGEIVLMGDLIDRGPDTPGVLAQVRELVDDGLARCLLGNHEYALLCGIGAPSIGLDPDPSWFELWRDRHGGRAVLANYRVTDARGLRLALGADLVAWLASLPWCLEGEGWLAVHASLRVDQPVPAQLKLLRDGWRHLRGNPDHLYDKANVMDTPTDLPAGIVLVSGHMPLSVPLISRRRILCDTSGGLPGRTLSGVVWPEGRVITAS